MSRKVLILILNWNKQNYVINLLKQIKEIDYKNYECLVVDNNSTDNSVEEINKHFPKIEVLQNKTNLGGTGGYNSGLMYALNNKKCEYVWLIDNDTIIESDTLSQLVNVLNSDNDIAIAGSRIVDINDRKTTIELGSFINWNTIGVNPNLRNKKIENFEYDFIETDYVAICSALVRTSALEKVGLMDERHFIFWDDIDWGLKFNKNGCKVVAVVKSVVYHPSFTERDRGVATDFYYSIRNSLLVYSKYVNNIQRLKIFYIYIRYLNVYLLTYAFNNNSHFAKFGFTAIYDFIFNNWGKCNLKNDGEDNMNEIDLNEIILKGRKILILFDRYNDDGISILNTVKDRIDEENIYALIDEDRIDLYEDYFHNIIKIDVNKRKTNFIYNIKQFIRILRLSIDYSFGSSAHPYAFATKNYFVFSDNKFYESNIRIFSLYKLIFASLIGEIIALFLTPIVFLSSLRYKNN